jgi:hypothetical protein
MLGRAKSRRPMAVALVDPLRGDLIGGASQNFVGFQLKNRFSFLPNGSPRLPRAFHTPPEALLSGVNRGLNIRTS